MDFWPKIGFLFVSKCKRLYNRIHWFWNFAVLQVDLECGKNSIWSNYKIHFSLFRALSNKNGLFGSNKVEDSLYSRWTAQSYSILEGCGKQWWGLGCSRLTNAKVGRDPEEVYCKFGRWRCPRYVWPLALVHGRRGLGLKCTFPPNMKKKFEKNCRQFRLHMRFFLTSYDTEEKT
jgi:hypothetical protein